MSHCVYLGRYLRLDRSFPNGCAVPKRKDVCESPLYTVEKLQRHMPVGAILHLYRAPTAYTFVYRDAKISMPPIYSKEDLET